MPGVAAILLIVESSAAPNRFGKSPSRSAYQARADFAELVRLSGVVPGPLGFNP